MDKGYIDSNTDIRNLACALTGKYEGDFFFEKIVWINTDISLGIMIGMFKDDKVIGSKNFQWKYLNDVFSIKGYDAKRENIGIAYKRYINKKRRKPNEMEKVIADIHHRKSN